MKRILQAVVLLFWLDPSSAVHEYELNELGKHFTKAGYFQLEARPRGRHPLLLVDQVWTTALYDKSIFAVLSDDLKLVKKNEVLHLKHGILVKRKTKNKAFAILFRGFEKKEVDQLVGAYFERKTVRIPATTRPETVPPSTEGRLCPDCTWDKTLKPTDPDPIDIAIKSIQGVNYIQTVTNCGSFFGDGLTTSLGDTASFFRDIFLAPTEAWDRVVENFVAFKEFAFNVGTHVRGFLSSIGNNDWQTNVLVTCSLIGAVLPDLALALAAGAGLAKVIAKVVSLLAKLKAMERVFAAVALMGAQGNRAVLVLKKLLSDEFPLKLKSIVENISVSHPQVAIEVLRCGL